MKQADLSKVLGWRNDPRIRGVMFDRLLITPKEHEAWFQRSAADPKRHLLIYEVEEQPMGFMNLTVTDEKGRIAEWGFYAAPNAPAGTGLGLGKSSLEYAFRALSLHKVCGEVLGFNTKSIRFHQRLGFSQEGLLREHHFDGERYHDVLCFGLLENEWTMISKGGV